MTDSIQQEINVDSSNSFRLLSGAKLHFNQTKKRIYLGAVIDYEFSGTSDVHIDRYNAEQAD